jgi:hypothetical protein
MILAGARNFIEAPNLILMAVSILVLYLPFFLLDVRVTQRYRWPQALIVIGLLVGSAASLILAEAILWGVPIW